MTWNQYEAESLFLRYTIMKTMYLWYSVRLSAVSPTNPSQFALPGTSMSRSNSIPAQDLAFDLRAEAHALGGSATSLEERPRGISRSGSFRDSTEEGSDPAGVRTGV